MQAMSSKNTSINSSKLPAIVKSIDWEQYRGQNVIDFGGGKFDNLKDYLKNEYGINMYVYDKFNRTDDENKIAWTCNPSLVICSNVLNVIDSDKEIETIIKDLDRYRVKTYYYIYEGDKSGIGRATKKDCYQRNMKTQGYLDFFMHNCNGVVCNWKRNIIKVTY